MNIGFDVPVAELLSTPLCSMAAFEQASTSLAETGRDSFHVLWRRTEDRLIAQFPGTSVDQLVAIRDRTWFGDAQTQTVPLHRYLRRIARDSLRVNGATCTPAVVDSAATNIEARSRLSWRWMTFYLPRELLLIGTWTDHSKASNVDLLAQSMRRLLEDKGFAECHLHVGAALNFELLWISTMCRVALTDLDSKTFSSPGAVFDNGRFWPDWLLRVAIARILLSRFLAEHNSRSTQIGSFADFLNDLAGTVAFRYHSASFMTILWQGLSELANGRFESQREPPDALRSVYSQLVDSACMRFPKSLDAAWKQDPISIVFHPQSSSSVTADMQFTDEGIRYLESRCNHLGEVADPFFAKLFWQSIRVRNLFYQHITQRPLTPGLQWFIRFYGRLGGAKKLLKTNVLVQSAATTSGMDLGLKSLEVRTSPSESISTNLDFVRNSLAGWEQSLSSRNLTLADREFGVVLHLTKERGGKSRDGSPEPNWRNTHADPGSRQNSGGYRYSQFFETKRREATSLGGMLLRFPETLRVIRGIDICTDELAVPSWVLAPHFRYLEDVGRQVSAFLKASKGNSVSPLRKTVHVGEDFIHLIGGLRAVSDCIQYLKLGDGDRIGHGVALGTNATSWSKQVGRIAITKEHRLFDLVWEWCCYTRDGVDFHTGRMAYVDDSIKQLSSQIFGDECSPQTIQSLIDSLHHESCLRKNGFPNGIAEPTYDPLVLSYLTNPDVFRRGHETIWVIPSHEAESIESLQSHVRNQVASRGIVIEINPTSNLLIGNLTDLRDHPLWRLRSPNVGDESAKLRLCIGSDDPITFACSLPEEYMLIHDAIVLAGLGADQADQWIESVRRTGLNARFTTTQNAHSSWSPIADYSIESKIPPILYG